MDGVLAYGATPLNAAIQAIRALEDTDRRLRVPVAFVTNACNRSHDKAAQIQRWLNIQVTADQVVHSPTPARLLTDLHDKYVLVVGQEHRVDIVKEYPFQISKTQNYLALRVLSDKNLCNAKVFLLSPSDK